MEDCKCQDLCKRLDELEKRVQAIEEAISSLNLIFKDLVDKLFGINHFYHLLVLIIAQGVG